MKRTIVATLLAASGAAYACGGQPCPKPTPAPTPSTSTPTPISLNSATDTNASATSGAEAGALAGAAASVSGLSATGTGGTGTGTGTGAASLADNSTTRALALSLFAQPPAFTPPMAQVACASASVKQEASSGWIVLGGYSSAKSHTDSADCTLLNIRNAMVKECKYASAKQVEDLLVRKHLPDFRPNDAAYTKTKDDPGFVDYTPTQCAVLLTPPAPVPVLSIEPLMPPKPPKPTKPRKAVKADPCPQQCKRPVGLI
jgi:hypothetical protein